MMAVQAGSFLGLLVGLSLVLVVAHALGIVADRLGFAPVLGELLTGLVLGPSVLGLLAPAVGAFLVPVPAGLSALASLGLVILLVLAGLEFDLRTVRQHLRPTIALAAGASTVPFILALAVGWYLPAEYLVTPEHRLPFALFLATALSISAVPVAVRVLIDLDAMDKRVGQLTVTAAVAIDSAGWIALAVVSDIARRGQYDPLTLGRTLALLGLFVPIVVVLGPRIAAALFRVTERVRSPAVTGFSLVLVVGIAMAAASLALGLEAVLGAFLAGVILRTHVDGELSRALHLATLGFFAPVFFATAGLQVDLASLAAPGALPVAGIVLIVAVVGKFLGVALGAAFTNLSRAETLCLAVGLNARGAMEIVVAAVGLALGILTPLVYAVIVLVAIVTSLMTPPLLRRALSRLPDDRPPRSALGVGG